MIRSFFISVITLGVVLPSASAACDISETKCAVNGGKCNIHFKNKTDSVMGQSEGSEMVQISLTQTIKVKALKANGHRAGNTLTLFDGEHKTMNVDKKANKNFDKIRITSPNMQTVEGITMGCDDVKAVLNGNGICKVFYGYLHYRKHPFDYALGYTCDGGKVVAPRDDAR